MDPKVYAAKCKKCGKLSYPSHFYCPACGATEFDPVAVEGQGTLLTWTRVYALPLDYAQLYVALGIVEMDQGIRATGQLQVDEPVTGMRVRASVGKVREIDGKDTNGLVFQPA